MFTKLFWKDAAERAVATFAQTMIAVLTVAVAAGQGVEAVNWGAVLSASLLAAGLSVLKSMAASKAAGTDTASLTVDNKELK